LEKSVERESGNSVAPYVLKIELAIFMLSMNPSGELGISLSPFNKRLIK
jgi:hypothetical protein